MRLRFCGITKSERCWGVLFCEAVHSKFNKLMSLCQVGCLEHSYTHHFIQYLTACTYGWIKIADVCFYIIKVINKRPKNHCLSSKLIAKLGTLNGFFWKLPGKNFIFVCKLPWGNCINKVILWEKIVNAVTVQILLCNKS